MRPFLGSEPPQNTIESGSTAAPATSITLVEGTIARFSKRHRTRPIRTYDAASQMAVLCLRNHEVRLEGEFGSPT